ncbi:MAG: ATP-binding protein [Planctomycetota bacterium]
MSAEFDLTATSLARRGRRRSIRWVLGFWYGGILMLLVTAMCLFLYFRLERDLIKQCDRTLRSYASDLADHVRGHFSDLRALEEDIAHEIATYRPILVAYRIYDEHGTLLFAKGNWGELAKFRETPTSERPVQFREVQLTGNGNPFRASPSLIQLPDGRVWTAESALSAEYAVKTMRNNLMNMLYFSLPLILAGIVGGAWLARKSLRPVVVMANTAASISVQNLSARVAVHEVGDELDQLAIALNSMLARIEEAVRRIERFSSELGHELRTPITQLIGETEAALTAPATDAELRELLIRHAAIYRDMRQMLNDLLALLRADTAGNQLQFEPLPARAVLDDVAESFRLLAEDRGLEFSYQPPAPTVHLLCHAPFLRRAVGNLLDNAIGHTARGGRISLRVESRAELVTLVVSDTGAGIPLAEQTRVFDRFFRGQSPRAHSPTGFGLGLSIAKQIVEDHGGSISLASAPGQGTSFTVKLPRIDLVPNPGSGNLDE